MRPQIQHTMEILMSPSPRVTRATIRELFPTMEIEGDNPPVGLAPQGVPVETYGTHILATKIDPILLLPLEKIPYVSAPYHLTSGPSTPLVPLGYNSLSDAFLDSSGATSLFHNPIWSYSVTPTTSSFISNAQTPAQPALNSQPVVMVRETYVPLCLFSPPTVATVTTVPTLSGKSMSSYVPPSGGKPPTPYVPPASC